MKFYLAATLLIAASASSLRLNTISKSDAVFCGGRLFFKECLAWTHFYDEANGEGWTQCSDSRSAPCDCSRVTCSDNGEITSIKLSNAGLSGTLSPFLSSLTSLTTLDLGYNKIGGEIPEIFTLFASLEYLDFTENEFEGPIPQSLENLSSIKDMLFRNNKLTGTIHSSLAKLTSVQKFNFRSNLLTGALPEELGSLTAMTNFILWENQLSGPIPDFFGNMTALRFLRFDRNFFSGAVPPSIATSDVLQGMSVYCNKLSGAVPALKWQQYSTCGVTAPGLCDINTTVAYDDNQFSCPMPDAALTCDSCRTTDTSDSIFCAAQCDSNSH